MDHDTSGERTRCFLKATIVFNNRMSSIDCIIRNISIRGARLEVDGSISIPQEFDLEIPARGAIYRATARWRDVHAIGVDFVEAQAAGRPESAIAAENRELRRQLDAMSRRLREMSEVDPA